MFSIIVAIGNNNEIGKDNKLLWHIPEDLKNFKKITTGKKIIMGRKTFDSIGRPLPNRENIILTRNNDFFKDDKLITVYTDIEKLINDYKENDEEIFVLGGEEIYKQFLNRKVVNRLYISHVDFEDKEADAYFEKIDYNNWNKIKEENYDNWKFCIYEK